MQWRACAARGAVLGAEQDPEGPRDSVTDAAMLALGAAGLEDDAGVANRAAFSSEQCVRVTL